MTSVLGKLIQKQFGRDSYAHYTDKLNNKESMDIFCDIYERLSHKSKEELNRALKSLLDTVQVSIRISKNFTYITLGCLVALVTLLCLGLPSIVLVPAVAVTGICYLYKLLEYIRNRYCNKDVKIVLIYKIALFHLLEETCLQKESHEI